MHDALNWMFRALGSSGIDMGLIHIAFKGLPRIRGWSPRNAVLIHVALRLMFRTWGDSEIEISKVGGQTKPFPGRLDIEYLGVEENLSLNQDEFGVRLKKTVSSNKVSQRKVASGRLVHDF